MQPPGPTITVFGSSRPGDGTPAYEQARELGRLLAEAGYRICNGGYGGTMEASARGAKEAGGVTVGVVTAHFSTTANRYIDQAFVEPTLVGRLLRLIDIGDAYVVLPGSTGTLLELAAVWEFMNKQVIVHKPVVVVGDFWEPVVATLREGLAAEARAEAARLVTTAATPAACASALRQLMGQR